MNPTLILLMGLLISFNTHAQRRTGGGPTNQIIPPSIGQGRILTPKSVFFGSETHKAFEALTQTMLKQELECGLRKSIQRTDTFMDTYYRLTLRDAGGECSVDSEILSCIRNSEYLKAVEKIKNDPLSEKYISHRFQIPSGSARIIIEYLVHGEKEKIELPDQ